MDREQWWIGVLFAIGSLCFALGAAPRYVNAVGVAADGITFFVGSIFFTSAAALQYQTATGRWRAWAPGNLDWSAGAIQLAGTLFFNISTFDAMARHLSAGQENKLVWSPDAFGSICFLVASAIALFAVTHTWWSWRPHERPWQIAVLNMVGSIAFGVSAVASFVVPDTDQPRNVTLMNMGTFVGALCFLAGALLLIPRPQLSTD
jgi:YrhK-like protein